jgi:plasmid stabilization system protein ParE
MAVRIVTASEAEQDVADAYGWYEGQRAGLGEEFLNCVDACIEAIRRTPEMHAIIYENYRRALLRRFPYALFYEYASDVVTAYGIFHTSRDPAKWIRRARRSDGR